MFPRVKFPYVLEVYLRLLPVYFRFLQKRFLLLVRRDLLLHPHCIDGFLGHALFLVAAFDIVGLCVLSSLCVKRIYSLKCYTTSPPNPLARRGGGGALGYFLGGYVPPGTPNWHLVLKKIPLKLIPRSRNGPIFYTPF